MLEQDRFRLNHFAQRPTWRLKRESCSIQKVESKIHVPRSKPSASIRNDLALALFGLAFSHLASAVPQKPDDLLRRSELSLSARC
jgi:hypothetical protein